MSEFTIHDARAYVSDVFAGDEYKIKMWWTTRSPILGGVSPNEMIRLGREAKLVEFIRLRKFEVEPPWPRASLPRVLFALSQLRIRRAGLDEAPLQDAIEEVLTGVSLTVVREARLGPAPSQKKGRKGRADFLANDVVVEVKKGRPARTPTLKQLSRYASDEAVSAVVLVAERGIPDLPDELEGKPLRQVTLYSTWGIAV